MSAHELAEQFEQSLSKRLRWIIDDTYDDLPTVKQMRWSKDNGIPLDQRAREAWMRLSEGALGRALVTAMTVEFEQLIATELWKRDRQCRLNGAVFNREAPLPDALRAEIDELLQRWEPVGELSIDDA